MVGDAEFGNQSPLRPAESSSSWTFNWSGFGAVLLIAVTVLVMWRWLGGSSGSNADDQSSRLAATASTGSAAPTAPSTTPAPSSTTSLTLTTNFPSTTTTVAPIRQVLISGEMKPCRFGANCLVASFTIDGFDVHPGRFVCIYPNSQRDFAFNDNAVDDACLTADAGDTIAIEVDGVLSSTISDQNLDGTP